MRSTADSSGMSSHFFADASSELARSVTGNVAPARVGRTLMSVARYFALEEPMTTGSTSPTGVPAHPPSANARRPPSISRLPPRLLTKSAIIRNCSGVNDAASTLPRTSARYANNSSRVFGKPAISSSELLTP